MAAIARTLLPLSALLVLLALGACDSGASDGTKPDPDGDRLQLAVIPKGETHEFWKAIHDGAKRAAEELDVEIFWKGPLQEDDRAEQQKVVQQFVTDGVDGIALAPLDARGLARDVRRAKDAGIPVVIFDSALEGAAGEDFASFVATDNTEGGRIAGREMARLLEGSGKVVMLRYQPGSASTAKREAGFLEALGERAGIEVVSSDQFAGASIESAKNKALNMIDTLRAADGIFCPNESATVGVLGALEQEGLVGKLKFVGFDSSELLANALEAGKIDAQVLQDPRDMGYRAVQTLVAVVRGEPVELQIDTAIALATPSNAKDPAIAALLR